MFTLNQWQPNDFCPLFYQHNLLGAVPFEHLNTVLLFCPWLELRPIENRLIQPPISSHAILQPHIFKQHPQALFFKQDFIQQPLDIKNICIAESCDQLATQQLIVGWRNERYAIYRHIHQFDSHLFSIERAAAPLFGFTAYGIHLNGYIESNHQIKLWLARRSIHKSIYPHKLDQMVAGGLNEQYSVFENLCKEAYEEAGIDYHIAKNALFVSTLSYCYSDQRGLHPNILYCFDLNLPLSIIPHPNDGEVESFTCVSLENVAEYIKSNAFKPNCALVANHFLKRYQPHLAIIE